MLDTHTGEERNDLRVVRIAFARTDPFFLVYLRAMEELACDPELTHDARRVLLLMLSRLDYRNQITLTQSEAGAILKMNKSQVSRAVRALTEQQYIRREGRRGKCLQYRLGAWVGWRGRREDRPA